MPLGVRRRTSLSLLQLAECHPPGVFHVSSESSLMTQPDRINVLDDIQLICREFRYQLKRGGRASIEQCLSRVDESSSEMLFQNLLHIDIEYRRRLGEAPSSDEYIEQFPRFARLVRQAFFESTLFSQEYGRDTPQSDEQTLTIQFSAAKKLGNYELIRELGRGGFGVVYEAKQLERGDRVALKTLPMVSEAQGGIARAAERLHRFRQEFRTLSEVNHPNLVGMQTLEVDGQQWFFTMDLVDGVDFLDYVRPGGKVDEQRLRDSLKQLARGIIALHDRNIVHRDLKPSNVMITSQGQLKLLDFGLVAELQQLAGETVSVGTKNFAGTPRYAAPEQVAGQRTAAVDWYAVGVMLFEALTGQAPFKRSGIELLVEKQTSDAEKLTGREDIPADLASLIDAFLERDPEQRPSDEAVAETLGIQPDSHSSAESTIEHESSSGAGHLLIGRESHFEKLETTLTTFKRDRVPTVAFITGRSGEGKTTLAEQFLDAARRDPEVLVFSGRCYDRESVPFKAVDCLIDHLVRYLRSPTVNQLERLIPEDIGVLAQLFPVLCRVEAIGVQADLPNLDSRQTWYRAFAALRQLLIKIGERRQLVLFIDDLQWGDADSAKAIHEMFRSNQSPAVMILGGFRSDESDESPFLKEWRQQQTESNVPVREETVELGPLAADQAIQLCAARLGLDPDAVRQNASDALEATHGNPYLLEQLIEVFDPQTGSFGQVSLSETIARKLARLPEQAACLLDAIAVSGQPVRPGEAAEAAGGVTNHFGLLTHMRSENLVRLIGSGHHEVVDTYHDKIRETTLAKLDSIQRKRLHLRYAEQLEASESFSERQVLDFLQTDPSYRVECPFQASRVSDLAYHFREAQDPRSFAYQMLAGELSHLAYASDDVVEHLGRAETSMPASASDAIRYRLYDRLAAANIRLKQSETGLGYYRKALEFAPSKLARAYAHFELAETTGVLGRYNESRTESENALKALGSPEPPSTLLALIKLPPLLFRIFVLPRARWRESADLAFVSDVLEQRIHARLTWTLYENPTIGIFYSPVYLASLATKSGNRECYAMGISFLAGHLSMCGYSKIGRHLLRRVEPFADQLIDLEARGEYLKLSACTHAMSGDYKLAVQEFEASVPLFEKTGSLLPLTFAIHLLRHLLQIIGKSSEETKTAREVLAVSQEMDDPRAQCWGHYDVASGLARGGILDEAKQQIETARSLAVDHSLNSTNSIFLATESFVLLQASDYQGAEKAAKESWRITKKIYLFLEYNCRAVAMLLESVAGPRWAEETKPVAGKTRLNWDACFVAWLHRNLRPHSLRARGRLCWVSGKRRKARKLFRKAVQVAGDLGAHYDRAKALLDLAAVESEAQTENRLEAIELLKSMESVIPYDESWLLGEHFDADVVAPPPGSE